MHKRSLFDPQSMEDEDECTNAASTGKTQELLDKVDLVRKAMERIQLANRSCDSDDDGDASTHSLIPSAPDTVTPRINKATGKGATNTTIESAKADVVVESRHEESTSSEGRLRNDAARILEDVRRLLEESKETSRSTSEKATTGESEVDQRDESPTSEAVRAIRNRARELLSVKTTTASSRREPKAKEEDDPPIPACPIRDHARRLLEDASKRGFSSIRNSEMETASESDSPFIARSNDKEDNEMPADEIRTHALRLLGELPEEDEEDCEPTNSEQDKVEESYNEVRDLSNISPSKLVQGIPSFFALLGFVFVLIGTAVRELLRVFALPSLLNTAAREFTQVLALKQDQIVPCEESEALEERPLNTDR